MNSKQILLFSQVLLYDYHIVLFVSLFNIRLYLFLNIFFSTESIISFSTERSVHKISLLTTISRIQS